MSDKVKTYEDGVRETLKRLESELGGMDALPGWKISEFIAEVETELGKPFVSVGEPVDFTFTQPGGSVAKACIPAPPGHVPGRLDYVMNFHPAICGDTQHHDLAFSDTECARPGDGHTAMVTESVGVSVHCADEIKKSALFTAKSDGAMHHTLTFSSRQVEQMTVLDIIQDDEGRKACIGYEGGPALITPLVSSVRAPVDGKPVAIGDKMEIKVTLS